MRTLLRSLSVLVVGATVVAACGDDGGGTGPIEMGLRRIPLAAYDEAEDEGGGFVQVEIVDIAAVSDLRGLDEPEPGRDPEDVRDELFEMAGSRPGRPEVDVALVSPPSMLQAPPEAFDDELGLDVGAVTSVASIFALPVAFTVVTGELSLSSSLEDVGRDVLSTRDDEDYSFDSDASRGVDPIGRPIRVAQRDDEVAISLTEDLVADWLDDDGESLADQEDFLHVAQQLDEVGVLSALIVEGDFTPSPAFPIDLDEVSEIAEQFDDLDLIEEPFDVVGIGAGEFDSDVVLVVVYQFKNGDDAEESVDVIDDLWNDAALFTRPDERVDDLVDVVSVEQSGDAVVVIVEPLDLPPLRLGGSLLFQQEILFVHN